MCNIILYARCIIQSKGQVCRNVIVIRAPGEDAIILNPSLQILLFRTLHMIPSQFSLSEMDVYFNDPPGAGKILHFPFLSAHETTSSQPTCVSYPYVVYIYISFELGTHRSLRFFN